MDRIVITFAVIQWIILLLSQFIFFAFKLYKIIDFQENIVFFRNYFFIFFIFAALIILLSVKNKWLSRDYLIPKKARVVNLVSYINFRRYKELKLKRVLSAGFLRENISRKAIFDLFYSRKSA